MRITSRFLLPASFLLFALIFPSITANQFSIDSESGGLPADFFKEEIAQNREADSEDQNRINEAFKVFEELLAVTQNAAAPNSHWRVGLTSWRDAQEAWEKTSANLLAPVLGLKHCAPPLRKARELIEQADNLFLLARDIADPMRAVGLLQEHENLQTQAKDLLKLAEQDYRAALNAHLKSGGVAPLNSGLTVGRQRPAPRRNERPTQRNGLIEKGCRLLWEIADLHIRASKSPEITESEEWKDGGDKLKALFDYEPESQFHLYLMKNCHCPLMTARRHIESLRLREKMRANPRASDARSLKNLDRAIQEEKERIQTEIRRTMECFKGVCNLAPPSQEECRCQEPPIPPMPARPISTICNMQEVAGLVFERYDTGNPIGIIKLSGGSGSKPTYLITLSGTEDIWNPRQATSLIDECVKEVSRQPSAYREAVLRAIEKQGIRNARIIFAAHSLGGMVIQNLVLDSRLYSKYQLQVDRVITFGSPTIAPRADGIKYVYVEHVGDRVLSRVRNALSLAHLPDRERGRIRIGGDFKEVKISGGPARPDLVWGDHSTYDTNEELRGYDTTGQRGGNNCLSLELSTKSRHPAERVPGTAKPTSEEIGEEGMDIEASRRGYKALVPPAFASNYRQGYDGVYWDPKKCAIVIGEAKGGYERKRLDEILGTGYGFKQGTIEWARAAAQRITRSRTTNDREVIWAEMILCVIQTGKPGVIPISPELCKLVRQCNATVRVEVFHTESKGSPTKHYVTAKYPR